MIGDEGFNGLENEDFTLLTAPKDGEFGRVFSSLRVGVENCNERIKNWRCCRDQLRYLVDQGEAEGNAILEWHHKKWVIVASFVNEFYH